MNKLYIFGDSNSLPFFGNDVECEKYRQFKGGKLPLGWTQILSKNLNLEENNFAKMGSSNSSIFQTVCNNIDKFSHNDYVIIGWTFRMRYQIVSEYDENYHDFSNVVPSFLPENTTLTSDAMNEFLIHKNLIYWVNEIYIWEKLLIKLSELIGFKIYFWSFDEHIGKSYKNNCNQKKYLGKSELQEYYKSISYKNLNTNIEGESDFEQDGFWRHLELLGMKQIWDETNGEVNDGHISELGHQILADLFYFQILKNENI